MKVLGLLRADAEFEAGTPPSPELIERVGTFIEEATRAGVLVGGDGLHPSARGKRVRVSGGNVTVVDGPFTESKELIASYAIMQVNTMEEPVEWTTRFLEVLGGGESELRPIFDPADFAPRG